VVAKAYNPCYNFIMCVDKVHSEIVTISSLSLSINSVSE